jgi:hypothetical protein
VQIAARRRDVCVAKCCLHLWQRCAFVDGVGAVSVSQPMRGDCRIDAGYPETFKKHEGRQIAGESSGGALLPYVELSAAGSRCRAQ